MAGRIRTIKPEILEDEIAAALSDTAWRVWVSLWLLADDYGNLRAGTKYLASQIWQDSNRSGDVEKALAELESAKPTPDSPGRIRIYTVNGQRYISITNWTKHQRIDNAGKHKVPGPEGCDTPPPFTNFSASLGEIPRAPEATETLAETLGTSRLDKDREEEEDHICQVSNPPHTVSPGSDGKATVRTVFEHWQTVMGYPRAKLDPKREARIKARLREGFDSETLCRAIDGAARSDWHMGLDPNTGGKKYNGIETVLRDAAQVEKFLELTEPTESDEPIEYQDYEDNDPPGTEYVSTPPPEFGMMLEKLSKASKE